MLLLLGACARAVLLRVLVLRAALLRVLRLVGGALLLVRLVAGSDLLAVLDMRRDGDVAGLAAQIDIRAGTRGRLHADTLRRRDLTERNRNDP
jgi:hypothetical protein